MALDTGRVTEFNAGFETSRERGNFDLFMPTLESGPNIGAALKAAREFRGLSLQDVADSTCIRRAYLAAIEEMRLDDLPSRPFTVGYIRAYAKALGLDSEAAVNRFKAEEPAPDEGLRAPVGVRRSRSGGLGLAAVIGLVVVGAIVAWNVAQRGVIDAREPAPAVAAAPPAPARAPVEGPLSLGAPLPAPVESTIPTPYETPGLEIAAASGGSADAVIAANKARTEPSAQAAPVLAETFNPAGQVYGAAASEAAVILQARESASLIVRGADGSVYFARQLAKGEAYRAPDMKGLVVDVSEPAAFQVFVGGQSRGLLRANQTPVSRLAD